MQFGVPCDIGDDEVVASFGVFFTPSLSGQTHVFQYPLRSHGRPYEANHVDLFCTDGQAESDNRRVKDTAVIKPSSRLTMRCTLDTFASPNFKPVERNGSSVESTGHNYKYALHSEPFMPKSDYCVAYFVDNAVHLTPVSTIQQMFPAHGSDSLEAECEEAPVGQSVTGPVKVSERHCSVQTSSSVTGMSMAGRLQRELNRQRSTVLNTDADTARQVRFFPIASEESKAMCKRLVSTTREPMQGAPSIASQTRETAENSLFPPEILVSGGITGGTDKTAKIIRSFASRYSVAEQVASMMLRCQVLPLALLAEHIVKSGSAPGTCTSVPPDEIVEQLRLRAVYMHGVWVSRTCLDFKGMAAALREVILLAFHHSSDAAVPRAQLNRMVNSAAVRRSVRDILETIAVLNQEEPDPTKRRWRLRYVPADPVEYQNNVALFKANFGPEEAAQRAGWEKRSRIILSHVNYINTSRIPPKLALETSESGLQSSAVFSHGGTGGATAPTLPRPGSTSSSTAELREQDLAPIRHFIRGLFAEHGVLNKMRAKEMVLKGREDNYPQATNQMLSAALQSSVQQFTDATWVLTSLGEPNVDKYRPFILQAALEFKQFETAALLKRVNEILRERSAPSAREGEEPVGVPDAVLRRVVKEIAEFKAGERLWHLKNGNAAASD